MALLPKPPKRVLRIKPSEWSFFIFTAAQGWEKGGNIKTKPVILGFFCSLWKEIILTDGIGPRKH